MPRKGVGQKEKDGSVRKFPLYCRLPIKKIKLLDVIASKKNISRTDAVSEALDLWIEENSVYIQGIDDIY